MTRSTQAQSDPRAGMTGPGRRGRSATGHVTAQVLALVALGMLAGAVDSWVRPVKLSASDPATATPGTSESTALTPPPTGLRAAPVGPATGPETTPPVTAAPAEPGPANPTAPAATPADAPLGLHITLEQARKLFEQGTPFLDARTEEEFRAGHIAGAFHLPSDAFTRAGKVEALQYLDQNAPVVIYCGGGECHASEYVAIELEKAGFKSYHIMKDGFASWKAAGYDVAEGDQ